MADRKYYVMCDSGCKFESMTKEQILAAIAQAVNEGTIGDIDTGFVTTIKTINGTPLKFFVGTQSEYEALTAKERSNLFALITNDTSKEALFNAIELLQIEFDAFRDGIADGSVPAKNSENSKQLQIPIPENVGYYATPLQVVERFTEKGLYYAEIASTGAYTTQIPLGVFYYYKNPSHVQIFVGGDNNVPKLRVKIYSGGDFSVHDLDSNTDVTETYEIRAVKIGG